MSTEVTRRGFIQAGAAGAATVAASHAAFASLNTPSDSANSAHSVSDALLAALGARIGLEVAQNLAPAGEALTLSYLDCAGEALAALRAGIVQGASWQCGERVHCANAKGSYGNTLGVALFRNSRSGREARVSIDATALSHIALIESASASMNVQKHAVMVAPADSMYRVSYIG